MPVEEDAVHVVGFPLGPVRRRPNAGDRGNVHVGRGGSNFEPATEEILQGREGVDDRTPGGARRVSRAADMRERSASEFLIVMKGSPKTPAVALLPDEQELA